MARSKIGVNVWCTAFAQVVASTWVELTVKKLLPSKYQRICSGDVDRSICTA